MLPKLVKQKIEENKSAMLDTLQTLIGIPSVATAAPENGTPYGTNCAKALDFMLQTAESFGLHTTNFDYHVGVADTSTDTAPYLGILAHLDCCSCHGRKLAYTAVYCHDTERLHLWQRCN